MNFDERIRLAKEVRDFLDTELEIKRDLEEKAMKAIRRAVETLSKFKDVYPSDVKEALDTLIQFAAGEYGYYSYSEIKKVSKWPSFFEQKIEKEDVPKAKLWPSFFRW